MPESVPKEITPFKPPFWLRPTLVQTLLASMKFRRRGHHSMEQNSEPMVLDCEDDVKLLGSYAKHIENKALLILLHGWEGSESSTYVMSNARYFYDRGCSIFRLNYRDHGDSHHLNVEPFHAARFEEVFNGIKKASELSGGAPIFVAGFSLGGNFALRLARRLKSEQINGLAHIFAISPVVDPLKASPKVDDNPLIRRYFYKKWTTSMRKKQAAFPDVYDFSDVLELNTVMELTETFLPRYTKFINYVDYFNAYRIWPDDLAGSDAAVSLIMSEDDPVIPAEDMGKITLGKNMRAIMLKHGGHNGFFESLTGPTWYDEYMTSVIFGE